MKQRAKWNLTWQNLSVFLNTPSNKGSNMLDLSSIILIASNTCHLTYWLLYYQQLYVLDTIIIFILQMRKQRHKDEWPGLNDCVGIWRQALWLHCTVSQNPYLNFLVSPPPAFLPTYLLPPCLLSGHLSTLLRPLPTWLLCFPYSSHKFIYLLIQLSF